MTTDTAKTPAVRLSELRREWGLTIDEPSAQAQNKALEPLASWLQRGEESPEIVIRAVQALLADPETSAIDRRTAVSEVIQQIAGTWANAGVERVGMLGLQAMLLAVWPDDMRSYGFSLVPMFDSAWKTTKGRERQRMRIEAWRHAHTSPAASHESKSVKFTVPQAGASNRALNLPEPDTDLQHLVTNRNNRLEYFYQANPQLTNILERYKANFVALDQAARSSITGLNTSLARFTEEVTEVITDALMEPRSMLEFIWWGQSRYSQGARSAYRRIHDDTTRLWWMAWEASEVALDLDVEPAASFLVEVLHQMGENVDEKRPLMLWLSDLVRSLRTLHENDQHTTAVTLGKELKEIAARDALGMPVTWARLEATSTRNQTSTFEERARRDIALDLDTPIDRGEWAVWLFREALLDRLLRNA